MALSDYQQKKVDVYIKHYSMISLQIRQMGLQWEVYYVIRYLDATRPLYMPIATCQSKQLAAVKISEIEDYIMGREFDQSDKIRQGLQKENDLYWYMIKSIQNALDTCQSEIEYKGFLIALSAELQQQSGVKIQQMSLC